MYHDISKNNDMSSGFQTEVASTYKVDVLAFEEQVKMSVGKEVVFTFDDGGDSFFKEAAPILEKYGFKGIFFITTAFIGKPGFLSKDQIKDLDKRGHIIGSHTHNHLRDLSALDRETIEYEWKTSVDILSEILQKKVKHASLPNGNGSSVVKEIISKVGITELYTSEPTDRITHINDMNILGRFTILRSSSSDEVNSILTSKMNRNLIHLKWYAVSIIKSVLGKYYYNLRKFVATH